jgi:uncharacterized membrane protein
MSQLAVLVFKSGGLDSAFYASQVVNEADISEHHARMAYEEIEELAKDGRLAVQSETIVIKDNAGKVKIRKTSESSSKSGARWGSFWGLLVGIIFAGPLLGLLGGLGLGALLGGKKHQPIDRDFMKNLSEGLRPNEAALFLLIDEGDAATLEHLKSYDATLYTTILTDDVREAIDNATKQDEVVAALEVDEDQS